MVTKFREKIALLVFFCLILFGLGGLIGYLHLGHSWNVTATNIDDATGTMNDYVTILCEGADETDASFVDPLEAMDKKDESEITVGPGLNSSLTKKTPLLDINEVVELYQQKNAMVFALDTSHPETYYDGLILKKGKYRIGVLSLQKTDTPFKIERQVVYFQKHAVDFVVVITPDVDLVERVSGIDVVISTHKESILTMGETKEGTFYIATPTVGSVGVIIISPSKVVSAKVLSEI